MVLLQLGDGALEVFLIDQLKTLTNQWLEVASCGWKAIIYYTAIILLWKVIVMYIYHYYTAIRLLWKVMYIGSSIGSVILSSGIVALPSPSTSMMLQERPLPCSSPSPAEQ